MSRFTLHSVLFLVGFLLAIFLLHGVLQFSRKQTQYSGRARIGSEMTQSTEVAEAMPMLRQDKPIDSSHPSSYTQDHTYKMNAIVSGIRSGTPSALRIVHPDVINEFSISEQKRFIPEIKNEILRKLIRELSKSDWLQWKNTELESVAATKTSARNFIDALRVVNFNLGRYAETAALLFSGLYYTSYAGRSFSSEEELYTLMLEADNLFKQRTPAAFSARVHLDSDITEDSTFLIWQERLRARFVAEYCVREPNQIENQFYLLSTIKEEYLDQDSAKVYELLLEKVNTRISSKFREDLRNSFLSPDGARRIMNALPELVLLIDKFYQISFDDKVLLGDKAKARSVYIQYASLFPRSTLLSEYQNEIASLDVQNPDEELYKSKNPRSAVDKDSKVSRNVDEVSSRAERRATFTFENEEVVVSEKTLVSRIERAGLIIIILLALGVLIRKKWTILSEIIRKRRRKNEVVLKGPLASVEPIDRSQKLRDISKAKVRSHEGDGLKEKRRVVND